MSVPPMGGEVQAQALRLLRERQEEEAVALLAPCDVLLDFTSVVAGDASTFADGLYSAEIELVCTPATLGRLPDASDAATRAIYRSLRDALPSNVRLDAIACTVSSRAEGTDTGTKLDSAADLPDVAITPLAVWKDEQRENQGYSGQPVHEWSGLRFRSESEVCIARALDQAGVLFFPNCRGRLGPVSERCNREPDFLICQDGKWGILEVDGAPFHPPTRAAHDHERARLFKDHGVRVVEHFDAARCQAAPDEVVAQFLRILQQS